MQKFISQCRIALPSGTRIKELFDWKINQPHFCDFPYIRICTTTGSALGCVANSTPHICGGAKQLVLSVRCLFGVCPVKKIEISSVTGMNDC